MLGAQGVPQDSMGIGERVNVDAEILTEPGPEEGVLGMSFADASGLKD